VLLQADPAGQVVHAELAAPEEYVLSGHGMGAELPELTQAKPAPQFVQAVASPDEYVPAAQLLPTTVRDAHC
jgi:hypothetical protein